MPSKASSFLSASNLGLELKRSQPTPASDHTLPPQALLFLVSLATMSLAPAAPFFLLNLLLLSKGQLQLRLVC